MHGRNFLVSTLSKDSARGAENKPFELVPEKEWNDTFGLGSALTFGHQPGSRDQIYEASPRPDVGCVLGQMLDQLDGQTLPDVLTSGQHRELRAAKSVDHFQIVGHCHHSPARQPVDEARHHD